MKYEVLSTKKFNRDLKQQAKKYPSVLDNVDSFFIFIEEGNLISSPITGLKLKGNKVFKARLDNDDASRGKSGGFRIIYYLVTSSNKIYPLTIYSKSDQDDIQRKDIYDLISSCI